MVGYRQHIADEICRRIACGETLRAICRDPGMPDFQSVYRWAKKYPEFGADLARARDVGYDAIAEQAIEIADTPVIGEETTDSPQGVVIHRREMLGHRKLQVWTRLQLLARWSPRYMARQALEHAPASSLEDLVAASFRATTGDADASDAGASDASGDSTTGEHPDV